MPNAWVSYCRIDDTAIFLDTQLDRYMALPWSVAQPLVTPSMSDLQTPLVNKVRNLGWLERSPTEVFRPPPERAPLAELDPGLLMIGPSVHTILEASWALSRTRLRLANGSLAHNLEAVSTRNRTVKIKAANPAASDARILAAFRSMERYLLTSKTCLLRSLALHRVLARRGIAASVVFGVKLQPFEAHCWVQHGGTLLNDTVERVGIFTPIRDVC